MEDFGAKISREVGGIGAGGDGAVAVHVTASLGLAGQGVVAGAGSGAGGDTAKGGGTFSIAALRIELDRELASVGAFCTMQVKNHAKKYLR